MGDTTNDPFSYPGATQQPGDFWRNLAMFGSQMALGANARTPQGFLANGPGFAGPFAAGIQGALQNSLDVAKNRSAVGLANAQTQGYQLSNLEKSLGLPMLQAKVELQRRLMTDPQFRQQYMQQMTLPDPSGQESSAGVPGQAAPAGGGFTPTGSPYARSISTLESNNNATAENARWSTAKGGPAGPHQFTAGTWGEFAKENPQYFANLSPEQVLSARTNPNLSAAAADWYARKNVEVLKAGGVEPTPQNLGIAHTLGGAAATKVLKASDDTPLGQLIPETVPQNPQYGKMTVGDLRRKFSGVGGFDSGGRFQVAQAGNGPIPVPQQAQSGQPIQLAPQQGAPQQQPAPQPQQAAPQQAPQQQAPQQGAAISQGQALHLAKQYEYQANQIELQRSLGVPIAGDPAMLRQTAHQYRSLALAGPTAAAQEAAKLPFVGPTEAAKLQQELRYAGPIQAEKSANSNVDLRPGGMVRITKRDGSQEWVKNPQLEKVQNPDGTTSYAHVTPPLPGSPPGTPGESTPVLDARGKPVIEKIAPDTQAARTKAAEDFAGKDTDSFVSAQNTHSWLEQMNHSAEILNANGGFLGTGPTAPPRLKFAADVNDILRTMGIKAPFDEKAIGAWEELKKATTTAGFELSSHYEGHARQAAQTIINATSAVPAETNSPKGFRLVSSGIQEAAQTAIDLHNYKQEIYTAGGDLVKAEVDFFKNNPAQQYARRAISRVEPYEVKSDKELGRYLPGTFLSYNGKVIQVPEREGAPSIPEYLRGASPFTSAK